MTRLKEISREVESAVPAGGAAQGASTIHPRRRLNALLAIAAIVVITAMVALLAWVVPLATSEVGAGDAIPKAGAGSAVIHDDAGNMPLSAGSAIVHDDAGNMLPEASAIHDDAGNVNR
jgi:ferric-dicitrate binding protein FerR (iron transport regulator)